MLTEKPGGLKTNAKQAGHSVLRLQSQHFGRLRWADHLMSGVRDQSDQRDKIPSLLKKEKEKKKNRWKKRLSFVGKLETQAILICAATIEKFKAGLSGSCL